MDHRIAQRSKPARIARARAVSFGWKQWPTEDALVRRIRRRMSRGMGNVLETWNNFGKTMDEASIQMRALGKALYGARLFDG